MQLYPEVQRKVREEVDRVVGNPFQYPTQPLKVIHAMVTSYETPSVCPDSMEFIPERYLGEDPPLDSVVAIARAHMAHSSVFI